jgi:hypothetical protein
MFEKIGWLYESDEHKKVAINKPIRIKNKMKIIKTYSSFFIDMYSNYMKKGNINARIRAQYFQTERLMPALRRRAIGLLEVSKKLNLGVKWGLRDIELPALHSDVVAGLNSLAWELRSYFVQPKIGDRKILQQVVSQAKNLWIF